MVTMKCKKKYKNKLKATTLPEAIISLVIIAIISGMAIMVVISITSSSNNQLKVLALYQFENVISEKQEQGDMDEDFEDENVKIEKTVTPYSGSGLLEVTYKVSSKQDHFLFEIKTIERKTNE